MLLYDYKKEKLFTFVYQILKNCILKLQECITLETCIFDECKDRIIQTIPVNGIIFSLHTNLYSIIIIIYLYILKIHLI